MKTAILKSKVTGLNSIFFLFLVLSIFSCKKTDDEVKPDTKEEESTVNCTLSDIAGSWKGTASNSSNTLNISITIDSQGKVTGSGITSTWAISKTGAITGGGSYSFISGSHMIVAGNSWVLQLNTTDKKTITGTFDVFYSSLHSMKVTLSKN